MKIYTYTKLKFVLLLSIIFLGTGIGQNEDAKQLSELSLEDLLNMDVTTASKSEEKQSDAPGILSVLSKDEISRFGGTTLRDILERVPGLIASGANYTNRTAIAARGDMIKQNSSHVLLLINGRPVREVQEGGVSSDMLEAFPVNIIERIEVIKGPGSVLYGSDAFSAVINVITEKAENNSVSVSGVAGNSNSFGSSGAVTLKLDDLQVVAGARFLKKAEWDTPYTAGIFMSVPPRDTLVNLTIPNRATGTYVGIYYKGLSFMTSYNDFTTAFVQGSTLGNSRLRKNFNNLGYAFDVNDSWNVDANVTYTHANLHGDNISQRSSSNLVAELTNTVNVSDNFKVVVGGLYNKNAGKEKTFAGAFGPETVISDGNISSYAFYTQLDYRVIENLKLIGGLQANKVEGIKLNIVPRAGLIWYPVSRLSVKALYSEAFRAPSINENNINYFGILIGSPDLNPEKVSTFDFSVGYQGEQSQLALNYFHSTVTDIVKIMFTPAFVSLYSNSGKITFDGIEFEGKYYANKNLYLTGSLLYQTNKDENGNKDQTPVANFGSKAGVSYVWDNGVTLGLFDIYQGDLDSKYTQNKNPDQGAYNLLQVHSSFDLNKLFKFESKPSFVFSLDIDNLLNKSHWGYDLGGTTGDAIPSIPGRSIYAGLNVAL